MVVDEVIQQETGYRPQQEQQQEQPSPSAAVQPVMSFEKTDVAFWLQIAQLVVLWMILREVSR